MKVEVKKGKKSKLDPFDGGLILDGITINIYSKKMEVSSSKEVEDPILFLVEQITRQFMASGKTLKAKNVKVNIY